MGQSGLEDRGADALVQPLHDDGRDGWWLASDGRWYPPELHPDYSPRSPRPGGPPTSWAPPAASSAMEPFRSPARLGRILQVGFAFLTILGAVGLGSSLVYYRLVDRFTDDPLSVGFADLTESMDRRGVLGVAQVVGSAIIGAVFIAWTRRLYRNIPALGAKPRFTAGWAVGGWFVPFLNLIRPKQVIDDIWRTSAAQRPAQSKTASVSPLVHLWWGAWIGTLVLLRALGQGELDARTHALLRIGFDVVWLLGAILAFWLSTRLTQRQDQAFAQRSVTAVGSVAEGAVPIQPALIESTRSVPTWLAAAVLPVVALVVAVSAAAAWYPGRSSDPSRPRADSAQESGVGTRLSDLETGDCYNVPTDDDVILAVEVVPCDSPHEYEVAAFAYAPESDEYPGEEEVILLGTSTCVEPFERYVGATRVGSGLDLHVQTPTADSWSVGNRRFTCAATSLNGEPLDLSVEETGGILGDRERTLLNVGEGECFDDPASIFDTFVVVDCAIPHDSEAFAVIEHPAGSADDYPGDDVVLGFAERGCVEAFDERVEPALRGNLRYDWFSRPNALWWESGHRSIVCRLWDNDLSKLEGSMLRADAVEPPSAADEVSEPAADPPQELGVGTPWTNLVIGECFSLTDHYTAGALLATEVVSCDAPHDAEVVAVTGVPANAEASDSAEVESLALNACLEPFERYVGASLLDSEFDLRFFAPTSKAWLQGDRDVTCYATSLNGEPFEHPIAERGLAGT